MDIQIITVAFLSFCLFLISLAVLFRVTNREDGVLWIIRAYIGVGIATGVLFARTWGGDEILFWASLYSLLTALFVFGIFSIMEASVTLRIFTEIARSQEGITVFQLLKKHNRIRIVKRRIIRLLHSGELTKSNGMYTLGKPSYFRLREYVSTIIRLAFE